VGIRIIDNGTGNTVTIGDNPTFNDKTSITIDGNNNTVTIGPNALIEGMKIRLKGDNNVVRMGIRVKFRGSIGLARGAKVIIGSRTTIGSAQLVLKTRTVKIGKDCMFSRNIEIRTTDSHPIFDLDSGERINSARDVVIGDYVWFGRSVVVMKGASVGTGSMIGLGSVITSAIPPFSVAAGNPARVLKENVCWSRHDMLKSLDNDPVAQKYVQLHRSALAGESAYGTDEV
jgi:acetyltransferase-like isoleucine patch superfamily enzyme